LKQIKQTKKQAAIYTLTEEQLQALVDKLYKNAAKDIKEKELSIRQKVKNLLFSLPELRTHIENRNQFISNLVSDNLKEKSKDIVKLPIGGGAPVPMYERIEELVDKRERDFDETIRYVAWIDSCIEAVKKEECKRYGDDGYFRIIQLKYWDRLSIEKIADMLNFAETTAKYHHNRLLRSLAIQFFGEKGSEV
jgi:hypothetical protein